MADRFTITKQVQTVSTTGAGTAIPVMRVYYTARESGVEGNVDVPLNDYTADTVARMVLAMVDTHDAVAAL